MKKGRAWDKVMYLLLGLIFLSLIGSIFLPIMKKTVKPHFEEGGLLAPKTDDEETAVIKGTEVSKIMIPIDELPKDHDKALNEIVVNILKCWDNMIAAKKQNYRYSFKMHS